MKYAETLKKGVSTSSVDLEYWKELKAFGVDCIEISCSYDAYMNVLDFPGNAEKYAKNAKLAGIEIWSIHLPFSEEHDVSSLNPKLRDNIIRANRLLIEAAGKIGIKTAVLHPSSEPISDAERKARLRLSKEAIVYLNGVADKAGITLAIENLPRTCLCNKADEMIELLSDTEATVVFDTNHSLAQDNISFLRELTDAALPIQSLHISDYDFVDERHRLPGMGLNDWNGILEELERAKYRGPLMYEIAFKSRDKDPRYDVTLDMLRENMKALAAGDL